MVALRRIEVHMVPVAMASSGELGWLVLSRRKHSKIARNFHRLDRVKAHWSEEAKAWFAHADISTDLLDAIEATYGRDRVSYCLPCNTGKPCKSWRGISQSSYVVQPGASDSTEVPVDHPSPPPAPSTPPPPPPPQSKKDDIDWTKFFRQWEDNKSQKQEPPPRPPPPRPPPQQPLPPPLKSVESFAKGVASAILGQRMYDNGIPPPVQEYLVGAAVGAAFKFGYDIWERAQGFTRQRSAPLGRGTEMSPQEAARMLQVPLPCTREQLQTAFRKALFVAHPDRGGSNAIMAKLNTARSVLVMHMGFT